MSITYQDYTYNSAPTVAINGTSTTTPLSEIIPPPGIIVMWYGINPPKGWKICDGSTVTISGANFVTPNLSGKIPFGFSPTNITKYPMKATGGAVTHVLTEEEMPPHKHNLASYQENTENSCFTGSGYTNVSVPDRYSYGNIATDSVGANAAHNNMPPYLVVQYIIKVDE